MLNTWWDVRVEHHYGALSFLPFAPQLCQRLRFNMSGTHVFSGAHHVGLSGSTINAASTVRETAIRYAHSVS